MIEPYYPKGGRGRPPIGVERMLCLYGVRNGFGLSDAGAGDAIYDSQATRRFACLRRSRGRQAWRACLGRQVAMKRSERKALPKTPWGEMVERIEQASPQSVPRWSMR